MSIPASNADSERGFSMLSKGHTDQGSTLKQSTIVPGHNFNMTLYKFL